MKFLETKISSEQLYKVFKNHLNRSIFIWEYPYFDSDGNDGFYRNFIDSHIYDSRKYTFQEDAIELSIKLNIFKTEYLDVISKIIYSKRNNWIKLLALDWLMYFCRNIPNDKYVALSEYSWKNGSDVLIVVQSILNLLFIENSNENYKRLTDLLSLVEDRGAFDRILNSLDNIDIFLNNNKDRVSKLLSVIENNKFLSLDQKNEFLFKFVN